MVIQEVLGRRQRGRKAGTSLKSSKMFRTILNKEPELIELQKLAMEALRDIYDPTLTRISGPGSVQT